MAYQGLAGLYRDFFGVPHMFAVVKLLGSRSLPAIIRALLDHISSKVSGIPFNCIRYHAPEGTLS